MRILLLSICLLPVKVFAQHYMPMTIKTPHGNIKHNVYQPGSNNYMYRQGGEIKPLRVFKRANLTVILKNDSVFSTTSKFDAEAKTNAITIEGKKKSPDVVYLPNDTKQVFRNFKSGDRMMGIPADTCWLFKVKLGKINAYSNVPMPRDNLIIAIQVGEGAILKLNQENLKSLMVNPNEKILELIKDDKLTRALMLYNSEEE